MYIYIQSAFSEEHLYNIRNKFSDENGNNSTFSKNCINCANNVAICIIIALHLNMLLLTYSAVNYYQCRH